MDDMLQPSPQTIHGQTRLPVQDWEEDSMTGYCLKCRESREIQNAQQVTMKNGRGATRGTCGECGTTMFRIGKAS